MSDDDVQITTLPTLLMLQVQYHGRTTITLEQCVNDFFQHLSVTKFLQKALRGQIKLPILRIETSQKAQNHVHLADLAAYLDERRAAAVKECRQLCRPP